MNVEMLVESLALVAYELAVAETLERQARHRRVKAMKLQAQIHLEFSDALLAARAGRKQEVSK